MAGGRPSKFDPEKHSDFAENLALLGATDDDLARAFDVATSTISKWKAEIPEFSEALKRGKDEADAKVGQRLFQRACGYSHKATKFATFEGMITDSKEYVEHYPPDTVACIFWLKNRRPDLWRDKVGLEHSGPDGGPIQQEIASRSTEEQAAFAAMMAEARKELGG